MSRVCLYQCSQERRTSGYCSGTQWRTPQGRPKRQPRAWLRRRPPRRSPSSMSDRTGDATFTLQLPSPAGLALWDRVTWIFAALSFFSSHRLSRKHIIWIKSVMLVFFFEWDMSIWNTFWAVASFILARCMRSLYTPALKLLNSIFVVGEQTDKRRPLTGSASRSDHRQGHPIMEKRSLASWSKQRTFWLSRLWLLKEITKRTRFTCLVVQAELHIRPNDNTVTVCRDVYLMPKQNLFVLAPSWFQVSLKWSVDENYKARFFGQISNECNLCVQISVSKLSYCC